MLENETYYTQIELDSKVGCLLINVSVHKMEQNNKFLVVYVAQFRERIINNNEYGLELE